MKAYTAHNAHESTSDAIIRNALIISAALAVLGLALAPLAGIIGLWLVGADFAKWATVGILTGFALAIAALLVKAWENSRWVLVEPIAADMEKERTLANADAEVKHATAERTLAEADAIDRAAQEGGALQINNAMNGGKIKASQGPKVTVNGQPVSWNQINQISQTAPEPRRLEFPREDVMWMLEQFTNFRHSKRAFINEQLPYSKLPAYPELYGEVIRILVEGEAIQGRSEGTAGHLVVKDVAQLAKIVDAEHPQGVVLELPATTPLPQTG